ncbi:MAG: MerC domain-containing protein [Verrucomicrobiota bacterium]
MNAVIALPTHGATENVGADRIGVIASVLCAVHCAVTPFLLLFAPAFGQIWAHPASHWLVALFVVPLAIAMTIRGFRVHRKQWIVASGLAGVVLVIVGALIPYWERGSTALSESGEGSEEVVAAGESNDMSALASHLAEADGADDDDVFVWVVGEESAEPECEEMDCGSAAEGECVDSCCPSLVTDSEGNLTLHIPAASVVTTLGGVALIGTHLGNLCACRRRRTDGDASCC